jgi:glycosyltransferase involved in cell wall biosynthesis
MNILIYDPLHIGHHLNWVRLVAQAVAPYAAKITFATAAQVPASKEFSEHLKTVPGQFCVDASMPALNRTGKTFEGITITRSVWAGLVKAVRKHRPDRVYLPYGDIFSLASMAHLPGSLRLPIAPTNVEAIFLAASFAYQKELPLRPRMRAYMTYLGMQCLPFGRLLFIDPIAYEWLERNAPSLARHSELLPDPVLPVNCHEKLAARAELGLAADGRWIASVGVLDSRKGVDGLVAAFASARLAPTDRLLLAGIARPEVLSAVESARAKIGADRIVVLNRFLSDREMEYAISAADLVAVTHRFPDHIGSASILIRATAAGRPVLASQRGWPGHVTKQHALGWIYPESSADRSAAIAQALQAAPNWIASSQAQSFAGFHSVERFGEILTAPLRASRAHTNCIAPRKQANARGRIFIISTFIL